MELHHPLLSELPEHHETIHRLKMHSDHFRRLFDEYHDVDKAVYRIEEEIDIASDAETEKLKKRRLQLKDDLYHMIMKAAKPTA